MTNWSDKEEDFLELLEKEADQLSIHFNKTYLYYRSLSTKFNVPILVISAVNSLTAIALTDFVEQKYVSILNAVLSALTGVAGSVQLYLKINEKMASALKSAGVFKKLALKISKELTLERSQRGSDGKIFLTECFNEYNADLDQALPMEKRLTNHLRLNREDERSRRSIADILVNMNVDGDSSPLSDV